MKTYLIRPYTIGPDMAVSAIDREMAIAGFCRNIGLVCVKQEERENGVVILFTIGTGAQFYCFALGGTSIMEAFNA